MPTKTTKAIAYAFPTSTTAKTLGFYKSGCYFVQHTHHNIEGSGQSRTGPARNAEGFISPDDARLVEFFHACEGDICPSFLKYGNPLAVAAIIKR